MAEPIVDFSLAQELGLNEEEYNRILGILGRVPTYTELGIFSVMWSEHCSYKNSILQIKTLPRSGGRLLVSAGEENAGLVDIGDGLAVAFKIESHNHPSAVEPYQGAATGVGGILRDIFTMGARPVASLNSLRFGKITSGNGENDKEKLTRSKYLFKNVVKGIGDYGNCFGVPTISGEIYFEDCYHDNPLVNAMAVGIVKHNQTASATAKGEGNPVFIVGSSTGKDGIHGATFASEEISEESESKRPSVQVGDPFTEKLLLEATLEVIRSGAIIGIQDMGAAGITCSSSEMSAKGKCGMKLNLDLVPLRDKNMSAYEIMLSESQERMLLVAEKGKEQIVKDIFAKWDLNCVQVGEVIPEDRLIIHYKGKLEADVPADVLVLGGGAPVYKRETKKPEYLNGTMNFDPYSVKEPVRFTETFKKIFTSPNIANKKWVYEQYDTEVRTNTLLMPGGDASVLRIKHSDKCLSMKTDCNGRYVYLNPYKGGMIAVCESARNVVCTGAKPLAITNCLNFGNPYNPEVYYQFAEAIRGIGDACRKLDTPVTGGNVSFYNQSKEYAVYPTPVIGMLGLIENYRKVMTSYFKHDGDIIFLLGKRCNNIGGSEYLKVIHNQVAGDAPDIDLDEEQRLQNLTLELIEKELIKSAHDVSDGGLATALAECCVMNPNHLKGCKISFDYKYRKDFELFGESQSRIIISVDEDNINAICETADKYNIKVEEIGYTGGKCCIINNEISVPVSNLKSLYYETIENYMNE
jgi:phosphoribosylformylglycinamidine synthase